MSWWNKATKGMSDAAKAAEKAAKDAADASAKAAADAAAAAEKAAKDAADAAAKAAAKAAADAAAAAEKAAADAAAAAEKAAADAAAAAAKAQQEAEQAAQATVDALVKSAGDVESWTNTNVIKPINNQVIKPTIQEVAATTSDWVQEAQKAGMIIDSAVHEALDQTEAFALQGCEIVVESAIAIGEYIEQNACNIFVGAAIGGVLAGLNANPEAQAANATTVAAAGAYMAAKGAVECIYLKTAASAWAVVVVEPLWLISDFRRVFGGDKGMAVDTLAMVMYFAICFIPGTVIATGGTVMYGILGWILTSLICTGNLPKQILDLAKQV
jgi:hypothetical protein